MKSHFLKLLTFLSLLAPSFAHEGPWTASRPDGHAPISVMGDHMHEMGEWMVSYRYMSMGMENLMKGSDSVTLDSQLGTTSVGDFEMVPTKMTMDMHMFGVMHAISDEWTIMGMINYLDNEMDMTMAHFMGTMRHDHAMAAKSSGLGDLKLVGLYDLANWDHGRRIHLNLGLSLPTGSIDEKSGTNTLGYGMQLGSGTWDFHPAITYLGQTESYSYGAQLGGILRIGENDQDYTLGNKFEAALWGARKITDSLSASAKFDYSSQSEIDGAHKGLTTMQKNMSPGNQASSQGRDITTFGLGLNYYFQEGGLSGHRLAAEWETPIDQKVNGVQLELDSVWTLGWQYAW
jgi:hypothetical protein